MIARLWLSDYRFGKFDLNCSTIKARNNKSEGRNIKPDHNSDHHLQFRESVDGLMRKRRFANLNVRSDSLDDKFMILQVMRVHINALTAFRLKPKVI